jgi:glutamate synthase (NADPH/NADH) large chain
VHGGYNIIILSDRRSVRPDHPDPVPAGHLSRAPPPDPQGSAHLGRPGGGNRRAARGAPLSPALAGYGAEAINPYLAFDTIDDMLPELAEEVDDEASRATSRRSARACSR